MKDGDFVTGTPLETDGPEQLPERVFGRLELAKGSIGSATWTTLLVYVKDSDGDEVPVECKAVSEAKTGEKVTVLS